MPDELPPTEFKPNIYPIMYWALAFGVVAGISLLIVALLSNFITLVWFPVFLAAAIWGGFRNYKQQKGQWAQNSGTAPVSQSPWEELKQAAGDVATASRELMQEETPPVAEEEVIPEAEVATEETPLETPEVVTPPEEETPPLPPQPPAQI